MRQCDYRGLLKVNGVAQPHRCPGMNATWVDFFQGYLCESHFLVLNKERQQSIKRHPSNWGKK